MEYGHALNYHRASKEQRIFTLFIAAVAVLAGAIAAVAGFGVGSLLTPAFAVETGTRVAVAAVAIPHFVGTLQRCEHGFCLPAILPLDPYLESLRQDAAFQQLVADLEQTYTAVKIQRL